VPGFLIKTPLPFRYLSMQTLDQMRRRAFLQRLGLGSLALGTLLRPDALRAADAAQRWTGILPQTHFPAKAKRVIWLTMAGGPSHLETFDHKPKLAQLHGQNMPESFTKGQQLAQLQGQQLKCFGPQWGFRKFGKSGAEICELFPHIGSVADDIAIIRSMHTDAINHDPAHCFINTGSAIPGRPSMGSWLTYGLGTDAEDLPGFVVLTSLGRGGQNQPIAARQWSSGFLPSRFQGVHLRSKGDAVLYLSNPPGYSRELQNDIVSTVGSLNAEHDRTVQDPEIATRIAQYEMAFRMQASVPGLMDMAAEPAHIRELYGCTPGDGSFASNCLVARRLAERGVRFIQLYHKDWDHHGGVKDGVRLKSEEIDRACMALITDLKQRGMFEDTLIVFAGEFGRTPMSQGDGRDHHMLAYSIWMAGGGIKGGVQWGSTDELGYKPAENPVHVHDVHATMLKLLGIEHTKLTYRFQGRDYRLTDVFGKVVNGILA
jgi:hypothetical protein